MSFSDASFRQLLLQAWPTVLPEVTPRLSTLQAVQSVAREETGYGNWPATNNFGAEQGGRPDAYGECPPGTYAHPDTHASGTAYDACFSIFASPLSGAQHLIRDVFVTRNRGKVLAAAQSGDQIAFDTELRASGYYELPLKRHIKATTDNVQKIAAALGEPVALCPGCGSSWKKKLGWGLLAAALAAGATHLAFRR